MYLSLVPPDPPPQEPPQPSRPHGEPNSSITPEPHNRDEFHTLAPLQPGLDQQSISCLIRYLKTKFPLELFLRLTDFMDTRAMLNLRLACRELEVALFPIFRKRFFTKRHICLVEKSLRHLVSISQDPRLAGQLNTVTVGCIRSLGDNESEDDALFIESGFDVDLLGLAFTNFINLYNVIITYSPSVSRPNIAPQFAALLGRDNPRKLFRKLLHALAKGSCEPRSFVMDHRGGTGGGFCMSDLHLSDSLREPLSRSLRTVKKLTLALHPNRHHTPYLMKFLAIPTRLEQFRLNLDRDAFMPGLAVLRAIAEAPPPSFSYLTQLELGKMTLTPRELVKFVRVFAPNLQKLQFFRIGLLFDIGDNYPYEHRPDPSGDPPYAPAMLWKFVFEELSAMPELEKLIRFWAGWLTERANKDHVAFRQTPSGGGPATSPDTSYNGVGASRFLGELAVDTVVPSPRGGNFGATPQVIAGFDAGPLVEQSDSDQDMDDDSEE